MAHKAKTPENPLKSRFSGVFVYLKEDKAGLRVHRMSGFLMPGRTGIGVSQKPDFEYMAIPIEKGRKISLKFIVGSRVVALY